MCFFANVPLIRLTSLGTFPPGGRFYPPIIFLLIEVSFMKHKENATPWEQDTYQIGSTPTPRPSRGPMAVMLVLIVILAGLLSMSGMLNVRLFATLYSHEPTEPPLSLEEGAEIQTNRMDPELVSDRRPCIGIVGDTVEEFHQRHFQLPEGLFITDVSPDASAQGIQEGDVLLTLDGYPITDQLGLDSLLRNINIGEPVQVTVYRHGDDEEICFQLTVTEAWGE